MALHPTTTRKSPSNVHLPLKSSLKQQVRESILNSWASYWMETQTSTACHLHRIMRDTKVTNPTKLYCNLSRATSAKLVQLWTSHCRLNAYLHCFNIAETSNCHCGEGKETVEHLLLACKEYKEQRVVLQKEIKGLNGMCLRHLLGDKKAIKHTMEYVRNTKRLDH